MTDLKPDDIRHDDGTITRQGKRWGCHYLSFTHGRPGQCIALEVAPSLCKFGHHESGRPRRSRWTCLHWKKITEASE